MGCGSDVIAYYNFCRIHGSLRVTPAMQAGLTDRLWTIEELISYESRSLDGAIRAVKKTGSVGRIGFGLNGFRHADEGSSFGYWRTAWGSGVGVPLCPYDFALKGTLSRPGQRLM